MSTNRIWIWYMHGNRAFILSVAALFTAFLFFELSDVDLLVESWFYSETTQTWLLDRENQLARLLFYDGIKGVLSLFVFGLIGTLLIFGKRPFVQRYKEGMKVVILSMILIPLTVSSLKAVTNVPCPKNITCFHGTTPYVKVLDSYPEGYQQKSRCRCYPAGHASGGFALLSLYFLFQNSRNRRRALAAALALGWTMGLYKMLIGDHFLSHTVVTMLLAWIMVQAIARYVYRPRSEEPLMITNPKEYNAA